MEKKIRLLLFIVFCIIWGILGIHCNSGPSSDDDDDDGPPDPTWTQVSLLGSSILVPGDRPVDAVAGKQNGMVYVVNAGIAAGDQSFGSLSFVTANGILTKSLEMEGQPSSITHTDTGLLYIANTQSSSLSVVEPESGEIIRRIEMPDEARPLQVEQDAVAGIQFIYILCSNRLYVYNEAMQAMVYTHVTHHSPKKMVINHYSDTVYVLSNDGSTIDVISDNASKISCTVGGAQIDAVCDEGNGRLFVLAGIPSQNIVVLDENNYFEPVYEVLPFGLLQRGSSLAFNASLNQLYVLGPLEGIGSIITYDTSSLPQQLAFMNSIGLSIAPEGAINTDLSLWDEQSQLLWISFLFQDSNTAGLVAFDPKTSQYQGYSFATAAKYCVRLVNDPFASRLYCIHPEDDSVTIINTSTMDLKDCVLGIFPLKMVFDSARDVVYAVSSRSKMGEVGGSGIICRMECENNETSIIDVGSTSIGLDIDPSSGNVFTGNRFYDIKGDTYNEFSGMTIINANAILKHVNLYGEYPISVAVDPGSFVYVIMSNKADRDSVSMLNTAGDVICPLRLLNYDLLDIQCSRKHNAAYITCSNNNSLIRFDEATCPDAAMPLQVPTGREPRKVLVDDANDLVYIANYDDGTVSVFMLPYLTNEEGEHEPLAVIDLTPEDGPKPHPISLAVDEAEKKLYIGHELESFLSVVDLQSLTLTKTIENVSAWMHQTMAIALEDTVTPKRLHLIHNEYIDYYTTRGWVATITLHSSPEIQQRQVGQKLSDIVIDTTREKIILSDLATASIFIVPAFPG